jgi:hypothetical protein
MTDGQTGFDAQSRAPDIGSRVLVRVTGGKIQVPLAVIEADFELRAA